MLPSLLIDHSNIQMPTYKLDQSYTLSIARGTNKRKSRISKLNCANTLVSPSLQKHTESKTKRAHSTLQLPHLKSTNTLPLTSLANQSTLPSLGIKKTVSVNFTASNRQSAVGISRIAYNLIKLQYTLDSLYKNLQNRGNFVVPSKLYLLLKSNQEQFPVLGYTEDQKLDAALHATDIYSTVAVLMLLVLKQQGSPDLFLMTPGLKSIFQHTLQSYLLALATHLQLHQFDTKHEDWYIDAHRLLDQKTYTLHPATRQRFISQTSKLKDTLAQLIRAQPKKLALFSFHLQSLQKNTSADLIRNVVAFNDKYSHFTRLQKQKQIKSTKAKPSSSNKEYTLFVDLDQTLVHYVPQTRQLFIRPYASVFLVEASKLYEVTIFTVAAQAYADWAIDILDTQRVIARRLYRQHAVLKDKQTYVKDIVQVGRSLQKSIIIDNLAQAFRNNKQNGILVRGWYGEKQDRVLRDLFPVVKFLAMKPGMDLRKQISALKKNKRYHIDAQGFQLGVMTDIK